MGFIYKNENGEEISLTQGSIRLLDIEGLASLSNEIITTSSVNQQGETYIDSRIDSKEIDILLRIKANDEEYRILKRRLMKIFNPTLKGNLILNNVSSKKSISTRVKSTPNFKHTKYSVIKECKISLVALDPFWRDVNETKTEIAAWKGNFCFPLFIPKNSGIIMGYREPSLIVNTENIGDITTGMRIEFKALGTVINPKLINIETQDFIKINKTLEKDEVIEVTTNFGNKKVSYSKNGIVENAFNYWDLYSSFLQLEIGDNLFRYDAESGLDNLEVTIYHTSRYIGV